MPEITIATRGSKLALAQANWVAAELRRKTPGLACKLSIIKTKGDKILDVPLAKVGGKGLFVKEIEDALLEGRADLAVHSVKDIPAELPDGLVMQAYTKREDPRDALISKSGKSLSELPNGARIGTSSLRRQAQLLALRPDFVMTPLRGNVDTRLAKLERGEMDAIILAGAGLIRLGLEKVITGFLDDASMLPAVGQGALGIEIRQKDDRLAEMVDGLAHTATSACVVCERAYLARLEGGCQVPIAGYAHITEGQIHMRGLVASLDGSTMVKAQGRAEPKQAEKLGLKVADELLAQGGREILERVYGELSS